MMSHLTPFLIHWATMSFCLWVASHVFKGVSFSNFSSLLIAALLLGLVNAYVRPALVVLTLPLTLLSLGFFLLVINALMVQFVSYLVQGFMVSSFWTAFFLSIFVTVFSFFVEMMIPGGSSGYPLYPGNILPGTHGHVISV
jgi:putative membrane protein